MELQAQGLTDNLQPTTHNMKKFRFLGWPVYRDVQQLFSLVLEISKKLPREFCFELTSQLIRSSFSVILNSAEGSGEISDAKLNRFFDIALGSTYETVAGMDTLRISGFVSDVEFDRVKTLAGKICDQLEGSKKAMDK